MRSADSFIQNSYIASHFKTNEKGHLGVSIFASLVDIPMPNSIIIDYAHASLLRHAKCIFIELYRRLRPIIRNVVDVSLSQQAFPHFFHRRMKSFVDLSFIKAIEIRNILFYGFLPIFHVHLPLNLWSHFALYITALRLLHTRPIFVDRTSEIANNLLTKYYKDFNLFYDGLENIVLHLHVHYKDQYERFGSLAHLGSFGQESLIGHISTNYTGTRYQGDLISENYSVDFVLHNEADNFNQSTKLIDGAFDQHTDFDFTSNDIFRTLHDNECSCTSLNSCLAAFRRCTIQEQIYHSLLYIHRQKSVSYFVRYTSASGSGAYSFGKITMFIKCLNSTYAVIQQHRSHSLFSDLLLSSPYYSLLHKSIDHFFFVVSKQYLTSYEHVRISRILDHCIIFDCIEYYIVTPVSSYDEHD